MRVRVDNQLNDSANLRRSEDIRHDILLHDVDRLEAMARSVFRFDLKYQVILD